MQVQLWQRARWERRLRIPQAFLRYYWMARSYLGPGEALRVSWRLVRLMW